MTSFLVKAAGPVVWDRGEVEYAAPQSMTPESWGWRWCFGVLCKRRFKCVEMCKCESCKVPARAKIKGTYSCLNSGGMEEVEAGCGWMCAGGREGIRQDRGASLWM